MALQATAERVPRSDWPMFEAYGVAVICLLMGMVIGYLIPESPSQPAMASANSSVPRTAPLKRSSPAVQPGSVHVPTMEEMKHMADVQAHPLLEELKSDGHNAQVLAQLGAIYHKTHQFTQAADYYRRAVECAPNDIEIRNKLASSLYRAGDVEGAVGQLNAVLKLQPNDPNALFNLGMIRWQGKNDGKGAVAAWRQLLKANPQLSSDRRAEVEKLMADVLTRLGQPGEPRRSVQP